MVLRGVLNEPAQFFAGLRTLYKEERREEKGPLLFAGICLATGLLLSLLAVSLDPLAPEGSFSFFGFFSNLFSLAQDEPVDTVLSVGLSLLLAPIGIGLYMYVQAAIQHRFVFMFVREWRGFRTTFPVVAYAGGVIVLLSWLPVLGYLLGLYRLYVAATGLRELHSTVGEVQSARERVEEAADHGKVVLDRRVREPALPHVDHVPLHLFGAHPGDGCIHGAFSLQS